MNQAMDQKKSGTATRRHLAMALLLGLVTLLADPWSAQADFADVTGDHWALQFVNDLARREIVKGYDGNLFLPEKTISRGEAVKISLAASSKAIKPLKASSFPDLTAENALLPYIETAKLAGYVSGYNDGTFRPDLPVTRAEFLKIFLTTTGLVLPNPSRQRAFKDIASQDWQAKYVYSAVQYKLVGGEGDQFQPYRGITRAEVAKIVYNYLQYKDRWDQFPAQTLEELEQARWINEDRATQKLPSLILSPALSDIARKHSKDLIDSGKRVDHIGSDGADAVERMQRSKQEYLTVGENVGWGTYNTRSVLDTLRQIHNAMMAEEPSQRNHRANVLSTYSDYTDVGVGVHVNKDKKEVIVVTVFVVRP